MYRIETDSPVMVTGATGYVAGVLIKQLLEAGVRVHAAVRDLSNTEKLKYLNALAEKSSGDIRYFKSDLLTDGAYEDAMAGCSIVFHTASPFSLSVKDPQKDLVDPALLGTRNVLNQATKTPSVKRVVVTSSVVAIYGDNADAASIADGIFTEEHWNTSSSLDHQPYSYSKVEAEKEAWKIAESQDQWDLVTINPSFVMGPGMNPRATSESFTFMKQVGRGVFKAGVPDIGMGVVDVRDVATAHIAAAYTPEAKGRYITSGHNTSFPEMTQQLLAKYGDDYPIPKSKLPKLLVWLLGPLTNKTITRKYVSRNVGYSWKADNSKSTSELGIQYRPLSNTMNEFFQQLIDSKQI